MTKIKNYNFLLTLFFIFAAHTNAAAEDKNLKKIFEFNFLDQSVMGPEQLLQQNRNQAPTHLNEQKIKAEKEKKAQRVKEILAGREGLVVPPKPSTQFPKAHETPSSESR